MRISSTIGSFFPRTVIISWTSVPLRHPPSYIYCVGSRGFNCSTNTSCWFTMPELIPHATCSLCPAITTGKPGMETPITLRCSLLRCISYQNAGMLAGVWVSLAMSGAPLADFVPSTAQLLLDGAAGIHDATSAYSESSARWSLVSFMVPGFGVMSLGGTYLGSRAATVLGPSRSISQDRTICVSQLGASTKPTSFTNAILSCGVQGFGFTRSSKNSIGKRHHGVASKNALMPSL